MIIFILWEKFYIYLVKWIYISFGIEQWKRQYKIRKMYLVNHPSMRAAGALLSSGRLCGKNPFSNLIAIWPHLLLFLATCWLSQSLLYFLLFLLTTLKICMIPVPVHCAYVKTIHSAFKVEKNIMWGVYIHAWAHISYLRVL